MAITGTIQGKDVIFLIQKNGVYIPFVCAKEVDIEIDADTVPTKTVGDGIWKKFAYQSLSYTITLSSVLVFDDNNFTGWDLLDNMLQFVNLNFKMLFTDPISGKARRLAGQVIITKSSISATSIDLVMNDISFPGTGPLLVQDPANDCNIVIASGTFFQTGTTGRYRVTGHSGGTISRVDYRIDDGGYLSSFPTTFVFDLPITGLTGGDHTIDIIPYCINGFPGTTYSATFTASSVFTVMGRVEIDPSTICGGSLTPLFRDSSGGSILYTDEALTTPITGNNIVILGDSILHLDAVSGTIGSSIGTCPTPIKSSWYRLSNSSGTICAATFVRLYSNSPFGTTGEILYTDAGMTTPVTGFTFIDKNTSIFALDSTTGVIGSFVGSCPGEAQKDDYVLGSIPSICLSPETTYYMNAAFNIGVILYINSSLTTQLSGKDKFALSSNGHIYNVNTGTGEVLSDSGATCSTGIPVNVILGNDTTTICGNPGVVLYVASSFTPGNTLFTNSGMTTPQTGQTFVVNADDPATPIYNLNTSTGVIGSATGSNCGAGPITYDLVAFKEIFGDQVTIKVTNESTFVQTTYTFNDGTPSKTFAGILTGGITYTIQVNLLPAGRPNAPITITGGDGHSSNVNPGITLTFSNVHSETAGITVEIGT